VDAGADTSVDAGYTHVDASAETSVDAGAETSVDAGAETSVDAGDEASADASDSGNAEGGGDADAEASVCSPLPSGATTIYVDAHAPAGGTGIASCPLRTITSALAVASPGATIQVAAGTYDAALGESFPLVVRGVSIVGAGSATTTISGRGSCVARDPNSVVPQCEAPLQIGHE
jgi:hypothetical protein